jgi:hypothetical protein
MGKQMSLRTDLYVSDDEFTTMGGELNDHCTFFADRVQDYLDIVDSLCAQISGQTSDTLEGIANGLRSLPGQIRDFATTPQGDCNDFIAAIDQADSYVY